MRIRENITRNAFAVLVVVGLASISGCLSDEKPLGETAAAVPGANSTPTISGDPSRAVRMGETYSFTPAATDPDGDSLSFSIENKPVWATFNTSTGSLIGTPTLGDVGNFSSITISVSDESNSSSLAPYSIEVTQVGLGSMTLSWSAPTQNSDGSTLVDLAGYRIYYGNVSGEYEYSVQIDTIGITTYVIENLIPNTYFVTATAFNANGIESSYSNEAIKVIN